MEYRRQVNRTGELYRDKPILRVWGDCDNLEEAHNRGYGRPISFNIVIRSHDQVDLSKLPIYQIPSLRHVPLAQYFDNNMRQGKTAEFTPVRLDRLSQWDDWKPYVQEVEYHDSSRNEWTVALVCLFDRSRVPKSFTLGDNLHRNYTPVIPNHRLEEALNIYLEGQQGKQQSEGSNSPGVTEDARDREAGKRSQTKGLPEHPLSRRRLRQRARVGNSREHQKWSGINDISINSQLVYLMPHGWKQIPHFLVGKISDDYSDAVVFGLAGKGTESLVGCLAISKNLFESGELHTMFQITSVKAVGRRAATINEQDSSYWTKFPPTACDRPTDHSWGEIGKGGNLAFWLSRFYSYDQMTPLIYPDSMNGPLAEECEYYEQFACQIHKKHIFYVNGDSTPGFDHTIKTFSFREGLVRWAGAANNLKETNTSEILLPVPGHPQMADEDPTGAADILTSRPTCFSLTSNAGPYYRLLHERMVHSDNNFDFIVENQHPLDKFLYYTGVQELWYASAIQQHLPIALQEHFNCRIRSAYSEASTSEERPISFQAAFEHGVCLLTGFGVSQDITLGLGWIRSAAESGSRLARAISHRLHRSYGQSLVTRGENVQWLVKEALCFSSWAMNELEDTVGDALSGYVRSLRLFTAKYTEDWGTRGLLREGEKKAFEALYLHLLSHQKATLSNSTYGKNCPTHHVHVEEIERLVLACSSDPSTNSLSPALLHHVALRYACCIARPETVLALLDRWAHSIQPGDLHEYILLTLHRGSSSLAMELLGRGTVDITSLSPASNPLFLLENVPPESVSPLVKFLVGMGLDVNQKAHPLAVEQNALYPTLFTTDSAFANGDPLTHVDLKLKVWIRARWLHFRDEITGNSITPLRWAIARDKPALVQALLEAGAEFPRIPDKNTAKRTQLAKSWSSELCNVFVLDQPCYNIRIARAFLDRHGSQQGQAPFAETPLGLIVMEPDGPPRRIRMVNYGHPDTLSSLLSLLRQFQPLDDPLLFWAAVVNNHEDIVRYLVRNGVDVELRYQGMTPLHTAVLHGRVNILQFLLESGADARATTSQRGLSTLHMLFWTAKPRKTESRIFNILLHHLGGTIIPCCHTYPSGPVVSPLHLAVITRRTDAVRDLLKNGADPLSIILEDIRLPPLEASFSPWRIQFPNLQRDFRISRSLKADEARPTIPLKGCTAVGIVIMWENLFSPSEAEILLEMLLPFNELAPPFEMTLFHCHPEKDITILHLLATSKLWSRSRLWERVVDYAKRSGCSDVRKTDTDGDTPLHYACVAFGGHEEEKIPLDMFTDSAIANGNTKQNNNLGLTPLEARFWSFVDGRLNCKGTSDVLCIYLLTSESMETYTAPPPAENSVTKQRLIGEHAEQAWWELEKAAEVLWKWDSKKQSMLQSMYGNICGVKFSPTWNTFSSGLRTELTVDMEPSRRILDLRD